MIYKEDWDKSKERFRALWEREIIDRCCVSVVSPKKGCKYPGEKIPDDYEELVKYWTDPDRVIERHLKRFENTYFGGDAFPGVLINFGPEAEAAYFGAKYTFDKVTVWFHPIINDWDKDKLRFDANNKFYQEHRKFAERLAQEGRGKFFVAMSDNASPADALAFLRGTENLLTDFYLEKERVKNALDIILKEWLYTEREFYEISKSCNDDGSCVTWLQTWHPGYHSFIQCDLSVMISEQTFDEFILPGLEAMCDSLERSIYHMDGLEQIRHLDMLLSIKKLDMIQWSCPWRGNIPELKKIQAAGKRLLLTTCRPDEVEIALSELSSRGLHIVLHAGGEDEAGELVKLVEKRTKA